MKTIIQLIAALLLLSSCSYFRVLPADPYTVQSIKMHNDSGNYIVLHRGEEAWHAYDLEITDDSLLIRLDIYLGYHSKYIDPKAKGLNQYNRKEIDVINSVHIFTSDTCFNTFDTLISLPASSILAVHSYEYARTPSRASRIVPLVLFPVVGTIILAALAVKSIQAIDWSME